MLGALAKVNLLGYGSALGKFVKVNDCWLEVVGVLGEQLMRRRQHTGGAMQRSQQHRLHPAQHLPSTASGIQSSDMKDDLDGVDLRLKPGRRLA